MRIAKKLLAMTVVLAMVLGLASTAVFASSDVRVVVDGYEVQFADQGPVLVDNHVLVPARGVFDHMGFDIAWDNDTRVATLTGDVVISIPADGTHFYVDGVVYEPVVPQTMLNNRLLLPLGAIADAVGATYAWDGEAMTATITTVVDEVVPADDADDEYAAEDDEDYPAEDEDDEDENGEEDEDENGDDEEDEDDDENGDDDEDDEEDDE